MVTIGVLALQGDFIEHQNMLEKVGATTRQVRLPADLEGLDGLIIPGGESTTIGKLATSYGLIDPLREFARHKPTWGTCAGMIFLAQELTNDHQPILGLMAIRVDRNAFGRQIDSFETDLDAQIGGDDDSPYHAVFIRAPIVESVLDEDNVRVLARLDDGRIVAVAQGHWLATAFHPELTDDLRLHRYFHDMVAETVLE